jgi:hypothetical protein
MKRLHQDGCRRRFVLPFLSGGNREQSESRTRVEIAIQTRKVNIGQNRTLPFFLCMRQRGTHGVFTVRRKHARIYWT